MKKTIEEKYTSLSELEHILHRPTMYIGSNKEEESQEFIYSEDTGKMEMKTVSYCPAMLKLVDEIISNSCDEHRRNDNLGLTKISVTIDLSNNIIYIEDNGGIPVVKHKTAKMYVPEFIFGQMRTSSNYDDSEDRNIVGTNGLGAVLTNIFSKEFIVNTADGKNSISIVWSNNMNKKKVNDPKPTKSHFTKISFELDLDKFDIKEKTITNDFISIIEKRCVDAAAANPKLIVEFNLIDQNNKQVISSKWKFNKFEEYIDLYSDFIDIEDVLSFKDELKQFWICPNSSIDVAFVNGAECSKGTHIKAVRQPINQSINEILKKKHKIEVSNKGIDNKYGIFGIFNISNPVYSSQTKKELSVPQENFYKDGKEFIIPEEFLKKIQKSEIVDLVLDWYKQKQEAEDLAKIRKLNRESKKLLRSDKFINCTSRISSEKELWVYEGDSAHTGARMARNPQTQATYRLRGVPLNTIGMTPTQVMKNQCFNDIVNILGLQWGEYNKIENLKFGKFIITSDADYDGDKIAGILICFLNHFPELFKQGMIYRVVTPIISAVKGKDKRLYYNREDFDKDVKKLNGYVIKYLKGVGSQDDDSYKLMMQNPHLIKFTKDDLADMMLRKWFGKGQADTRKSMLKESVEAE